jgi:ATP-dependent RNA helicase RhlE
MSIPRTEPARGFDHLPLAPELRRAVADAGFAHPRPIQERTIPAAVSGRDVLGLAQTGTGKTAAFALPILHRLMAERRPARPQDPHAHGPARAGSHRPRGRHAPQPRQAPHGPRALIVAPTRELASQIGAEIRMLGRHTRVGVAVVFGGVSVSAQLAALRQGPEILVACPGRLLDLMGQGAVTLDAVSVLVLDEADHMFDMGFLPDVRRILAALPAERQNMLFSATMPPEIRGLAKHVLHEPHVVELGHSRPVETVAHELLPVDSGRKVELLERVLAEKDLVSAIVFTRTKHRAKRLARQLDAGGHRAVALQGNMSQGQRERAMEGFRTRQFRVLVATDIAARGLDIEQVSHVVNFDMPTTPEGYTHRIGRTGRSERRGRAYTFITPEDAAMVREVERRIGSPIPRRAIDGFSTANPASEPSRPRRTAPRRGNPRRARRRR